MARTEQEVRNDYGVACAQAGELEYRLAQGKLELTKGHSELNKINQRIEN